MLPITIQAYLIGLGDYLNERSGLPENNVYYLDDQYFRLRTCPITDK